MFCYSWTTYLEQLTCQSARQGSQLHRIQKRTGNINFFLCFKRTAAHRDFLIIARYKYSYLLTYLLKELSSFRKSGALWYGNVLRSVCLFVCLSPATRTAAGCAGYVGHPAAHTCFNQQRCGPYCYLNIICDIAKHISNIQHQMFRYFL